MKNYVIDFETYYDTKNGPSAGSLGIRNYVAESEAYIVSVVGPDLKWVGEIAAAKERFPDAWWENQEHQFWAAYAGFDRAWAAKYWPAVAEGRCRPWKCVLDRAAVAQLPRNLAQLSHTVLRREVDKSMREYMDGRSWDTEPADVQEKLKEYCLTDSVVAYDLLKALPEMSVTEDRIAEHTRAMCWRGVRIDENRLEEDITRMNEALHAARCAVPWHMTEKILSQAALAEWCRVNGLTCPKSVDKRDAECTRLMQEQPKLAEVVRNLRMYRKCNTLIEKAGTLQGQLDDQGVLPLEFLYCGAPHTRRWSCRGVNVQNLDKEPVELAGGHKVWSRQWLTPRPGKCFLILDLAQIEPRCLNWLVGNDVLLDAIRAGFSVYEAFAKITGEWDGAPGTMKKQAQAEGQVAWYTLLKNKCLGCGYGMGPDRFADYANVGAETAEEAVREFRDANPLIAGKEGLWNRLDRQIAEAARDREHTLSVVLPTGEALRHFYVSRKGRGVESYVVKGDFSGNSRTANLWGGVLTENLCQRMARDVFAEGVLALERAGFPVIFHAHDEVILEVDEAEMHKGKSEAKEEAVRLLRTTPEWCQGLPLDAEGGFEMTYTK